jgi:hypothetical protein
LKVNWDIQAPVTSLWGLPGTGKTAMALTWPKPMLVIVRDRPLSGLSIFLKKKRPELLEADIRVHNLRLPLETTKAALDKLFQSFNKEYQAFLDECAKNRSGGTVVFDTATSFWQLVQMWKLWDYREYMEEKMGEQRKLNMAGEIPILPAAYHPANTYMENAIQSGLGVGQDDSPGVNLVLIHSTKEEYVDNKPTQNRILQGFARVKEKVDIQLRFSHLTKTDIVQGKMVESIVGYLAVVEKYGSNGQAVGSILQDQNMTYDTLMSLGEI